MTKQVHLPAHSFHVASDYLSTFICGSVINKKNIRYGTSAQPIDKGFESRALIEHRAYNDCIRHELCTLTYSVEKSTVVDGVINHLPIKYTSSSQKANLHLTAVSPGLWLYLYTKSLLLK
jgi:hypothetical protein